MSDLVPEYTAKATFSGESSDIPSGIAAVLAPFFKGDPGTSTDVVEELASQAAAIISTQAIIADHLAFSFEVTEEMYNALTPEASMALAWGDASPRVVVVVPAGKLVRGVEFTVSQAFNGVGASITVGDSVLPDRLMLATQSDPTAVGTYTTAPSYRYTSSTPILLTINPGSGASTGAGLLTLSIEA